MPKPQLGHVKGPDLVLGEVMEKYKYREVEFFFYFYALTYTIISSIVVNATAFSKNTIMT